MTMLWELTLRSSAVVLVGLGLCVVLRQRSAASRHAILAAALAGAAAVGPLSLLVPGWEIVLPAAETEPVLTTAPVAADARPFAQPIAVAPVEPLPLALAIWAAGVAGSALMLLLGVGRLAWVARRSETVADGPWTQAMQEVRAAYDIRRPVEILRTQTPDLLATVGLFRPRVLLPAHAEGWPAARIRAVLCHELAHIRRGDWLVQIGAEALRTLYWFNPLLWAACSRLRRESEYACDDAVLATGLPAREYAAHLLELARMCRRPGPRWGTAVPMARASTLERRITAMLNPSLARGSLSRRMFAALLTPLLCVTVTAAALRPGQAGPAPLAGSVYDSSGAVLPEVQLLLEDAQQVKWHAASDAAGRFEFPTIPAGRYMLEASRVGFRPLRQQIDLTHAGDWDRAITLQVAELRETITVRASRMPGVAPGQAPSPVRIGGNLRPPLKLVDVKPVFPASMREAGREGIVPMEAIIARDGSVSSVRVLSADVHPDFAIAAADAVRQWRFDPTLLNGEPVEVRMMVSVEFSLSE